MVETTSSHFVELYRLMARHEHHAEMPQGEHTTADPIDGILWAHILIMGLAFGIVFPVGLVLGLTRNRWHVSTQTLGGLLAILGFVLGHLHKGRQFEAHNIHASFGNWLLFLTIAQVVIGVYLKLHLQRGILAHVRKLIVKIHYIIAIFIPIFSWVQFGFGVIVLQGFCHADHLGQCLAHGIMGSSFIAYGYVLAIMLHFGDAYLRNANRSQEFYDSSIITLWGIVNTFTEHRWGQSWSHGDYQHTSMGIIWWCAGMLGIALSKNWKTGEPRRNHVPALVMIFTGWAMSQHAQHLMFSTKVHAFFGYALMCGGIVRIIEIAFVLKDKPSDRNDIKTWQYLTPFLLIESGICFCGANEEQLQTLYDAGVDHSSYLLVISSCAFLIYLLCIGLIYLYIGAKKGDNDGGDDRWKEQGHIPLPTQDSESNIEMESLFDASTPSSTNRRGAGHRTAPSSDTDIILADDYDEDVESLRNIH